MSNRDLAEYLDCLGFSEAPVAQRGEEIIAPASTAPQADGALPSEAPLKLRPWLFVLDKATQSNPDALQLFEKMLGALGLQPENIQTLFYSPSQSVEDFQAELEKLNSRFERQVFMGSSLQSLPSISASSFFTSSPAECLKDASLKRPVWDTLQKAQRDQIHQKGY